MHGVKEDMMSRNRLTTLAGFALLLTFSLACLDDWDTGSSGDDTDQECTDGEGGICWVNHSDDMLQIFLDGESALVLYPGEERCVWGLQWSRPIYWRAVCEGWEVSDSIYAECDPRPIDIWQP